MRVLVSGASGLLGSALVSFLEGGGHSVTPLVRSASAGAGVVWDPAAGVLPREHLDGFDAVVHLAGESIAGGRWTEERKARIRDSRVDGTRLLAGALAKLERPPAVLICASAIGYYGDRGEQELDEDSAAGSGFLADVCREWEQAAAAADEGGIRVVNLRLGMILSAAGGALAQMLTPFRWGGGGVLGGGRQYMSWVSIDDVVGAVDHTLRRDELRGPVNVVSPTPVTNREFTKTLGRALGRPTLLRMPAFAVRAAFGEMGDALLLSSTRVLPKRLIDTGYEFRHASLASALRAALGLAGVSP